MNYFSELIIKQSLRFCSVILYIEYLGFARPLAPMGPRFGRTKWLSNTSSMYLKKDKKSVKSSKFKDLKFT